jgi:hypothetical protein
VIESSSFSGVRFFAIQISGLDLGTPNGSVRIEKNMFSGNAQDIYVAAAGSTGSQIAIADNIFSRTRGVSVQIKQGDQIRVSRNQFKGLASGAVWVGDWSVFEEGGVLSHVTVDDNRYTQSGGVALQYVFFVSGARGSLSDVTLQGNSVDAFREPPPFQSAAIYLEEAQGALVAKNQLTMAPGAGTANVCAGVRVVSGKSVVVQENVVNGTGNLYAYGVFGTNLSHPDNKITNNTLNHCQLQAGGAAESNNQIVYP